jgi:molybdopterin-containing oxidoreductase family iron-sulfur binding subunit
MKMWSASTISRRRFLILAGSAIAVVALSESQLKKVLAALHTEVSKSIKLGMVVDLRKCNGNCDACVEACNKVHNIPTFGPKDAVWWIRSVKFEWAFPEQEFIPEKLKNVQVPVLCNHCDNPPCVQVCPTQATWKREDDGIVMMDWHRCIGCRYCMAACPYGSRSFNWRDPREGLAEINPRYPTRTKGVVEKCAFCVEKVDVGEQPACVEACENDALVFGNIESMESAIREILDTEFTIRRKPELKTGPNIYYII